MTIRRNVIPLRSMITKSGNWLSEKICYLKAIHRGAAYRWMAVTNRGNPLRQTVVKSKKLLTYLRIAHQQSGEGTRSGRMLVQAQKATALAKAAVRNAVSNVPHGAMRSAPRGAKPAAKPAFSMASLWRLAAWASTAATALFIAIVATRSDVGSDRVSGALASLHLASPPVHAAPSPMQLAGQAAGTPSRGSDVDATTRQLTQAVRFLTEDRDRLAARVAMLERNVDDITGSINRQIAAKQAAPQSSQGSQAVQASPMAQGNDGGQASQGSQANRASQASTPWPSEPAPALATPDTVVAAVTPVVPPPAGMTSALPPSPLTPDPAAAAPAATAAYGVDLGGGRSPIALRARWTGIHAAHPQLFEGLEPVAAVRPATKTKPAELRLIVGPVTTPEAAAQLCASLTLFRVFCRPAPFGGDHLALR
jgi:hypothetical protein